MSRKTKTYVYIDGFNLYYGSLKNSRYKWLDLKKLITNLLQEHHDIQKIKYYTARVSGRTDPNQPIRQQTYIRALKSYIEEFEVHYDHFLTQSVSAKLVQPISGIEYAEIWKTEEKGSDVNLAVHLLNDAWEDNYDCAVVVSNDGDLSEAINLVRKKKKLVGLVNPSSKRRFSKELNKIVDFKYRVRNSLLRKSQLPKKIPGTNITKPKEW